MRTDSGEEASAYNETVSSGEIDLLSPEQLIMYQEGIRDRFGEKLGILTTRYCSNERLYSVRNAIKEKSRTKKGKIM